MKCFWAILATTMLVFSTAHLSADDFEWVGVGNTNWNLVSNWVNVTPGGGSDADGIPDGDDHVFFGIDAISTNGNALSLTVDPSATFQIRPGVITLTQDGAINNQGVLKCFGQANNSGNEVLSISGNVMLDGGGELIMEETNDSVISGPFGTVLTNVDNTIRGAGLVGVRLVNQNLVRVETDRMRVSEVDNELGNFQIADDGMLQLVGGDFEGGTIAGELGARIAGASGSSFKDTQFSGDFDVSWEDVHFSGAISNNGSIAYEALSNNGENEFLYIDGLTTLSGGGEIQLLERNDSFIAKGDASAFLVNTDNTIRGTGSISVDMENHGTVRAEFDRLAVAEINNLDGNIEIGANGFLKILSGDVFGGRVTGEGGGRISSLPDSSFRDVDFEGDIRVSWEDVRVSGDLTNSGTITYEALSNNGENELLIVEGPTELGGGGEIVLLEPFDSFFTEGDPAAFLTNRDNTIRGTGQIRVDMANQGTIRAEQNQLTVWSIDNVGGSLEIGPNALLKANGGNVVGGTLTGELGSRFASLADSTFVDVAFAGDHRVSWEDARISGDVSNSGNITFETLSNNGENEILFVDGTTNLQGGGEIVFVETNDSYMVPEDANAVLNNLDNTIRGTGLISVNMTNQGLVRAEGGRLSVAEIDNSGGNIEIGPNGLLKATGGDLIGGTITGEQGSRLASVADAELRDAELVGDIRVSWEDVRVAGTITNRGSISFESLTNNGENENLFINGTAMLDGGGEIVMLESDDSRISNGTNGALLLNLDNTIRGSGIIFADMVNQGTLLADNDAGSLRISGDTNLDNGTVAVLLDGTQFSNSGHFQVTTPLNLAGALKLKTGPQFFAVSGDTYEFMSGNLLPGSEFQSVDVAETGLYKFNVLYGNGFVEVEVDSVLTPIPPTSFNVTRGQFVSGDVTSLATSDNQDLVARRNPIDFTSRTFVEMEGTSPVASPTKFNFTVESSVFARAPVEMTLDFFNFQTSEWESFEVGEASRFIDRKVNAGARGDLSRFVNSGDNAVRSRIRYLSVNARQQFSASIDNAFWAID